MTVRRLYWPFFIAQYSIRPCCVQSLKDIPSPSTTHHGTRTGGRETVRDGDGTLLPFNHLILGQPPKTT